MKSNSSDTEKFAGVSIKQFPKGTDQGLIMEFFMKCGLPESDKDKVNFGGKGTVTIKDLQT